MINNELIPCLYCQTKNEKTKETCSNCGMPLASNHPESEKSRLSFFVKAFWLIAIFCVIMMYYLPR